MENSELHIVMVGHVDHGKSTVIGRLLYDTKALPEGTVDKVKRIAQETGKPFEYAYLLDAFEEEQKQGITIDTTQLKFHTASREYVIIDAPGHKEFLKNMISGASDAEVAFLIVDAARGVEEQTKRHAYILRLLGIRQIYVLINKMDLVDYEQTRFVAVKAEVAAFLATLQLQAAGFLPVSAYYGENLVQHSAKMPWYTGKSFIATLDSIKAKPTSSDQPLRLPIQDVFKFDQRRIIAGRIEAGELQVDDKIKLYPSGRETVVTEFANWASRDAKVEASVGQSVGIQLQDEFFNQRGEIITRSSDQQQPTVTNVVQTNLFWMGQAPLVTGQRYKLKIATQQVIARVLKVLKVTDSSTLATREDATKVQLNDVAEVVFQTETPLVYDLFTQQQVTGRFVIVDGYDVAGGGTITEHYQGDTQLDGAIFSTDGQDYQLNLFDQYCLTAGGQVVTHEYQGHYQIGAELPLKGSGYAYPTDFAILLAEQDRVLTVKAGRFSGSQALTDFRVQLPVVDSRGAQLNLTAPADLKAYLTERESLNDKTKTTFYQKWLDFNAYHQIVIEDI
ncbi:sulfate adenylyltransferase subunit 1 [Loigolactobacillus binensis]|uniref:sulfate adenylyltransferase n=1 Tax=Loigolactobacillus binensis TaxID=2559922 RepID=A0ABW3E9W7_9LACO|nr:GTP-binding protein [Loigolactobacillus binensis]